MTKSELIDRIQVINRGATREFLSEFSERELNDYIRQLCGFDLRRADLEVASESTPFQTRRRSLIEA